MATARERPIYFLGRGFPTHSTHRDIFTCLRNRSDIRHAVAVAPPNSRWVASEEAAADELVGEATEFRRSLSTRPRRFGSLVLLEPPRISSLVPAQGLFASIVCADRREAWLPLPDLLDAIAISERNTLIIGGVADPATKTITVYRGDLTRITVPFSIFKPTSSGNCPNFDELSVIDYGHAIRLGRYESSADAIFYDGDPVFRKKLKDRRREEDRTFGACLRRLRTQRRLTQDAFKPLSDKTIARIEAGASKPQGRTLEIIARRLEVEPDSIESY